MWSGSASQGAFCKDVVMGSSHWLKCDLSNCVCVCVLGVRETERCVAFPNVLHCKKLAAEEKCNGSCRSKIPFVSVIMMVWPCARVEREALITKKNMYLH